MKDEKRDGQERRRIQRGGRRATDLRSLTPELQAEAAEYVAEIDRCVDVLNEALETGDLITARKASRSLKRAADALHQLLASGSATKDA